MPNLNTLILTAADYSVIWSIPTANGTVRYPMLSASEISWEDDVEGEYVRAIGTKEPIGNKTNSRSYKGTFSLQAGELNAILQLTGFTSSNQIEGATLAIAALVGGFAKVYKDVNILTDATGTQAGAKQTVSKLSWQAIGIK